MAVRSALPWPFRWAMLAIVAGFCAAIALWAFEFGKDIAGLDKGTHEQLQQALSDNASLRTQVALLTEDRNKAQAVADTVHTLLTTEKVAQEKLVVATRQLEADNQKLKSDLGFFEQLIPTAGATGSAGPSIRGLQVESPKPGEIKWQVLVIQASQKPGRIHWSAGTHVCWLGERQTVVRKFVFRTGSGGGQAVWSSGRPISRAGQCGG